MCKGLFKKKKATPLFYEEEPADAKFSVLADFVREIETKADFNKAIDAMKSIFDAYQKLRGIKTDDDMIAEPEFMLHPDEGGSK